MLSEARKREKIANAILGTAMAVTAAQSPKDMVKMGHVESPGVALMQMFSQKRKEAERNLDHGRVSHGARNIKASSERSRKNKQIEESNKYKKVDSPIRKMKSFEQFYAEAYVPLRTSDEMHDDEGFPTRTRKWSKKMTDARMGVGREKAKGRYGATPNISRGVAASRKLEKMKAIDAEPESVRRSRGEARQRANNMLGANRRRLQTAMDREHLENSLKKEDFMMEMRKEDKVKGEKKTPLFVTSTSGRVVKNPETGRLEVKKATRTSLSPRASIGRIKQAMKSPLNKYGEPETYGAARHPHGGGGSGAKAPGRKRGVGKIEQQKIDKEKRDKGERDFSAGQSPAQKVELKKAQRARSTGGGY